MKRALVALDILLQGKLAFVLGLLFAGVLAYLIFWPLPWRHFPDVIRIFMSSWLFLLISVAIAYSGFTAGARSHLPVEGVVCLVIALVWDWTPLRRFVPFNVDRMLALYGFGAMAAFCLRRAVMALRGGAQAQVVGVERAQ